ncbi:6-phosphogluconate dehydrogenase [Pavlovales sp. CCMP2436]|nr:6-phosphogluconate dehydrogenase [Pavlovales sp. CCMP2436]
MVRPQNPFSAEAPLTIVVAGGGNAAHVLLALLGSKLKYVVRLWDVVASEVETFKSQLAANRNQMILVDTDVETIGTVECVSADPADVLPGADLLLLAVPAFAHEIYLRGAVKVAKGGKLAVGCMVAEGGLDWQLRDIYKEDFPEMITFALETLPWACRLSLYGRASEIKGCKKQVSVAVTPAIYTEGVLDFLNSALSVEGRPQFQDAGNYMATTLMNINGVRSVAPNLRDSIFHPAIVRGQFEQWAGEPYAEPPPLYGCVTQKVAGALIEALSAEVILTKEAMCKAVRGVELASVVPIMDFFMNAYREDVADASTLASALNTNKGYRALQHSMVLAPGGEGLVPDWKSRHLTEDIPFGLVPMKGIAELVGVSTPNLDKTIEWCQMKMGKEYLVAGRLVGKDVCETRCPQRYGICSIAEMVTLA